MVTFDSIAQLAQWASQVRFEDIPSETVDLACSQLISNIASIRATQIHPLGQKFIDAFGSPVQEDPKQAAYVMAGMSIALDFDEIAYSGHLSASCVNTAIAYSRSLGLDGRRLITAIVVANECAARFQASTLLGPFFRGQSGTYLHLVGAACARLHAEGADKDKWVHSLGLALGILPQSNNFALLDSDAKAFIAASSVRASLDACDAADKGFVGSAFVLDGPEGVLAQLSDIPMPEVIVDGLGDKWYTDTLSFKRFPGSAYLQSAYECSQDLHCKLGAIDADHVDRIEVVGSILTSMLATKVEPFLRYSKTPASAATFAIKYGIATLLATGQLGPADFSSEALSDDSRWTLASKIRVIHSPILTMRMVRGTVPLGEALRQAGDRALRWPELLTWKSGKVAKLAKSPAGYQVARRLGLRQMKAQLTKLGPPSESFKDANSEIGAFVTIFFKDLTQQTRFRSTAIGMVGSDTRSRHSEIVGEKFESVGGNEQTLNTLRNILSLDADATNEILTAALF